MRSRTIVAALFGFLCSAAVASAQNLSLEFHDGRVRLNAENVPVSRILAEWTRVGGTRIVNGERVPGAPLTLQIDAPEREALDTILRTAAGYMVMARATTSPTGSSFDKILVLPTTTRAPAAASAPAPVAPPPQFPRPEPDPIEIEEPLDGPGPQGPPPPVNFPRGRVPNLNMPNGPIQQVPPRDNEGPLPGPIPDQDGAAPPAPANPFGIVPGPNRPGTINPPPQRDPGAEQIPR